MGHPPVLAAAWHVAVALPVALPHSKQVVGPSCWQATQSEAGKGRGTELAAAGSEAWLVFHETHKRPLQNPWGWVVDDIQGALCLEGMGPGAGDEDSKPCPCPMGPPCSPAGDGLAGYGDV